MTTDEVVGMLDGAATAAAVGAAMELGLFRLLGAAPLDADAVAGALGIPPLRCGYWLQLLVEAGLLEQDEARRFRIADRARHAVTEAYAQPTWALLAEEARERLGALADLPRRLRTIDSAQTSTPGIASTYERMASDGAAARRFTRMLFEVHRPLARELARALDLEGVTRLMDLGGGSGVVSIELARRHPALSSTIVDLPTVCAAGAEVVAAEGLSQRISFHPADFLRDPLPRGFPVVLECDVDVYDTALLQNVRAALDPGGRYLVVDQFAPRDGDVAPSRAHWAFARSMLDPTYTPMSLPRFRDLLESNGFDVVKESRLEPSPGAGARFARGVTVLEARRAA